MKGLEKIIFLEKKFCCVIIWDSRCGIMGEMRQFLEPEGGMGMAGIGDFCGAYRKVLLGTSFFLENKKEAVASFLHFVYLHSREM